MKPYSRILAFLLSACAAAATQAQCIPVDCLDELPPSGGLCAAGFATGRVNVPYADAISFHVTNACVPAAEFNPDFAGASVRITQMGGFTFTALPAGLSGATNQPTYSPPANGCGLVSGTPTEAGVFAATVNILVNVNVWPFSLSCGGLGPLPQANNPVSQARELVILPDPAFAGLQETYCLDDTPALLTPTGTPGGAFSGPGVVGSTFHPALAGPGTHAVRYVVSAQQGAAIAAATDSLDVVVVVSTCATPCEADAGTLGGVDFVPCVEPGGSVEIFAIPMGDAVVPQGYELVFVLTTAEELIVLDTSDEPVFSVTEPGLYTIHGLVHDPLTLDLAIIEPGVTTGFDVNALLEQGGGAICGSLDVVGASYVVVPCGPVCDAFAGTLAAPDPLPCVGQDGEALVFAIPVGDAVVPVGFEVVYILTQGPELVVQALNEAPAFTLGELSLHTIHTLVYGPATLDLDAVVPLETTGFEVAALLLQGGGDICGSLDVAGFPFVLEACAECEALAGGLFGSGVACLEDGVATLQASPDGAAVVPDGFQTIYILTSGAELVVVAVSADPLFTVEALGAYTIHTLVYDPLTLDLDIVEIGSTTGFEVNALLLQGGGAICASLDVAGAAYSVEVCTGLDALAWVSSALIPNPNNGDFGVRYGADATVLLELTDMTGRVVHAERRATTATEVLQVRLAGQLAPGTYLLCMSSHLGRSTQRMVVGR